MKEYSLVCFERKTVHYQNFSLPVKSPLGLSELLISIELSHFLH